MRVLRAHAADDDGGTIVATQRKVHAHEGIARADDGEEVCGAACGDATPDITASDSSEAHDNAFLAGRGRTLVDARLRGRAVEERLCVVQEVLLAVVRAAVVGGASGRGRGEARLRVARGRRDASIGERRATTPRAGTMMTVRKRPVGTWALLGRSGAAGRDGRRDRIPQPLKLTEGAGAVRRARSPAVRGSAARVIRASIVAGPPRAATECWCVRCGA